jgi:hypothetical protein
MNVCKYVYSHFIMLATFEIFIIAQVPCFDLCVRVCMNQFLPMLIL